MPYSYGDLLKRGLESMGICYLVRVRLMVANTKPCWCSKEVHDGPIGGSTINRGIGDGGAQCSSFVGHFWQYKI